MVLGSTNRQLDSSCLGCFGQLPEFQNVSNANYNAFEASLTRQPKNSKLGTAVFHSCLYLTAIISTMHPALSSATLRCRPTIPVFVHASGDSDVRQRISFSGGWDLPFDRLWSTGPKRLTQGWSLYPILTWRTGFPFDISAQLPDNVDPANPGSSGAGDPYLIECRTWSRRYGHADPRQADHD